MRGNYRADRHGPLDDTEVIPSVEAEAVPPPPDLTKAERAYWTYFAPLLASARVLTPADRETLADYCVACRQVATLKGKLQAAYRSGVSDEVTKSGRPKRVPDRQLVRLLDPQLRGWIEKKTRLAGELGLTALARTRIKWTGHHQQSKAATPERAKSKLAQLQEQAAELRRPVGLVK